MMKKDNLNLDQIMSRVSNINKKIPALSKEEFFEIWEIIDKTFFHSRELMNLIKFKKERKIVSKFLYELEKICIFAFIKVLNFNLFIYSEIFEIVKQYILNFPHKSSFSRYVINQKEFHDFSKEFKYLFSCFDKLLYINIMLNQKVLQSNSNENIGYDSRFTKDFANSAKEMVKTSNDFKQLSDFIKLMDSSDAFHYIRKFRNNIEHNYINPTEKKTINIELKVLVILIMRTMFQIKLNYKKDTQLFEEIKQKNTKIS